MIFLILAILFSTGVFVAMRLFKRFGLDNHQALMWNYVFATGTGFVVCESYETIPQLVAEPWFGLSLLTGFWFIFTYLLMTASTQRSGVTVTSLSSKISVVLPILAGIQGEAHLEELSWPRNSDYRCDFDNFQTIIFE